MQTVIVSNFQRSYRARAKSEREFLALPQSTRDFISQLAGKFDMQNALTSDELREREQGEINEN